MLALLSRRSHVRLLCPWMSRFLARSLHYPIPFLNAENPGLRGLSHAELTQQHIVGCFMAFMLKNDAKLTYTLLVGINSIVNCRILLEQRIFIRCLGHMVTCYSKNKIIYVVVVRKEIPKMLRQRQAVSNLDFRVQNDPCINTSPVYPRNIGKK